MDSTAGKNGLLVRAIEIYFMRKVDGMSTENFFNSEGLWIL